MNINEVPLEYQILPKIITPADEKELAEIEASFGAKMLQSMSLRKVTTKRLLDARSLLERNEDPFLVAVYLKIPFTPVAEIANKILEERGLKGRIPTDVPNYLKLAAYLAAQKQKAAPEGPTD